ALALPEALLQLLPIEKSRIGSRRLTLDPLTAAPDEADLSQRRKNASSPDHWLVDRLRQRSEHDIARAWAYQSSWIIDPSCRHFPLNQNIFAYPNRYGRCL